MATSEHTKTLIALDVGEKRIGIAVASMISRLPRALGVLPQSDEVYEQLSKLIDENAAGGVVIGLPRNLNGDDTAQTAYVRDFGERLQESLDIPIYWIDEALTSQKAEEEYRRRGKVPGKGDIDALAACYILTDFLASHQRSAANEV